jgi:hypothetical protein
MYGAQRLLADLTALKYTDVSLINDSKGLEYVKISKYEVQIGRFIGRVIDLAIPAPSDYPRTVGASIHIKSDPQLLEKQNVPNRFNIIDSNLGPEWKYWSFRFTAEEVEPTKNLMEEINGVFQRI